jgi:heme a synthase
VSTQRGAMREPATRSAWTAARFALIGTLLMVMLTGVSAYLRLSNAGIGCEPWPACYAQAGNTAQSAQQHHPLARLIHRMLASSAGIIVLLVVYADLTGRSRPRPFGRAILLLALTVALAGLGRITPGATSLAISLGNLLLGAALTALLWWLALQPPARVTADSGGDAGRPERTRVYRLASVILATAAVQFVLGALLSTSGGAAECNTLPLCTEGTSTTASAVHLAHRAGALILFIAAGTLAFALPRERARTRWCAAALGTLIVLQAAAGAAMLTLGFPLWLVLAHHFGALLTLLAAVAVLRL